MQLTTIPTSLAVPSLLVPEVGAVLTLEGLVLRSTPMSLSIFEGLAATRSFSLVTNLVPIGVLGAFDVCTLGDLDLVDEDFL